MERTPKPTLLTSEWQENKTKIFCDDPKKRDHDVAAAPIINPTVDEPKQHLEIQSGVLFSKSDLGIRTIKVLNLNDKKRVIDHRNELSSKAALLIHEMEEDVETHKNSIDEHLSKH